MLAQLDYIKINSYDELSKLQLHTCEISSVVEMRLVRVLSVATTLSTAMLIPRRRSIGFMPAATAFTPSARMALVSTVAVVVPGERKRWRH